MGDEGEYWRAHREYVREQRRNWVECPICAEAFGGHGTKTPPGKKCYNCGWQAPNVDGSFPAKPAKKKYRRKRRKIKCAHCDKKFKTEQNRDQHMKDKHHEEQPNA